MEPGVDDDFAVDLGEEEDSWDQPRGGAPAPPLYDSQPSSKRQRPGDGATPAAAAAAAAPSGGGASAGRSAGVGWSSVRSIFLLGAAAVAAPAPPAPPAAVGWGSHPAAAPWSGTKRAPLAPAVVAPQLSGQLSPPAGPRLGAGGGGCHGGGIDDGDDVDVGPLTQLAAAHAQVASAFCRHCGAFLADVGGAAQQAQHAAACAASAGAQAVAALQQNDEQHRQQQQQQWAGGGVPATDVAAAIELGADCGSGGGGGEGEEEWEDAEQDGNCSEQEEATQAAAGRDGGCAAAAADSTDASGSEGEGEGGEGDEQQEDEEEDEQWGQQQPGSCLAAASDAAADGGGGVFGVGSDGEEQHSALRCWLAQLGLSKYTDHFRRAGGCCWRCCAPLCCAASCERGPNAGMHRASAILTPPPAAAWPDCLPAGAGLSLLPCLTDPDLQQMGIAALGARKKLLLGAEELTEAALRGGEGGGAQEGGGGCQPAAALQQEQQQGEQQGAKMDAAAVAAVVTTTTAKDQGRQHLRPLENGGGDSGVRDWRSLLGAGGATLSCSILQYFKPAEGSGSDRKKRKQQASADPGSILSYLRGADGSSLPPRPAPQPRGAAAAPGKPQQWAHKAAGGGGGGKGRWGPR